jgi:dihydrolipoamide dehydrogenase
LVKGVEALMRTNVVEVVTGIATVASANTVQVALHNGSARTLETRHVILATGGRARILPGITPDGTRILTYREAIVLREPPASVVIVGAGPVGMAFAEIWQAYGAQVTVVEMLPRVLPLEDEEVCAVVERAFRRCKIKLLTSTRRSDRDGDGRCESTGFGRQARAADLGSRDNAHRDWSAAQPLDYDAMPRCTYCQPAVASFGISES